MANALEFVRETAPVIVHLNVPHVLQLIFDDKDGRYRNAFETGTGAGMMMTEARKVWEVRVRTLACEGLRAHVSALTREGAERTHARAQRSAIH